MTSNNTKSVNIQGKEFELKITPLKGTLEMRIAAYSVPGNAYITDVSGLDMDGLIKEIIGKLEELCR